MAATRSRPTQQTPTPTPPAPDAGPQLREISVDAIDAPISTRPVDPDHVESLALSIRERGLDTPITVYEASEGRYVLGAGRHRLEAHRLLGLPSIAALVRPSPGDDEAIRIAQIAENLHRRDMLPIEEAEGVAALLEACATDTYRRRHPDAALDPVEHVAAVLARPHAWVRERMYISRLAPRVRELARIAEIPAGHLRELARVGDPLKQLEVACSCAGVDWWSFTERDDEDQITGWDPDELEELRQRLATRTTARPTVQEIRERVDRILRPLRGVRWELELPVVALDGSELRACAGCPHNSGSDRVLFAVAADAKHDVCADGSCYAAKRDAADKAYAKIQADLARRKTVAPVDEIAKKAPVWLRTGTVRGLASKHRKMVEAGAEPAANGSLASKATVPEASVERVRNAIGRFEKALEDWSNRVNALLSPHLDPATRLSLLMLTTFSTEVCDLPGRWRINRWASIPTVVREIEGPPQWAGDLWSLLQRATEDPLALIDGLLRILRDQGHSSRDEDCTWFDARAVPIEWLDWLAQRAGVELPPEPRWEEFAPSAEPAPAAKKAAKKPRRGKAAAVKDQDDDGDEA